MRQEIEVFYNTSPVRRFTFVDVDDEHAENAFDLTDVTELEFVVKDFVSDADGAARFIYTLSGGDILIAGAATLGKIDIKFAAADLDARGRFRHFLRYTRPDSVDVLMHGPLIVK